MEIRCSPQEEKLKLSRQGMVGYICLDSLRRWDGHLYRRLERAERQAARLAHAEVVLVRDNGECFHQRDGVLLRRVIRDGNPLSIPLHARARRVIVRGRPKPRVLPANHGWYAVTANRYAHLDR